METQALVKVLIVEDSITTRRFLVNLINETHDLMVCGEASNGVEAIKMVEQVKPHVISMDIQMPRMDGIEATKEIMATKPIPIVVVSAGLGQKEVDFAMLAIEAGALAALEKPTASPQDAEKREEFLRLLRLMARVHVIRRNPNLSPSVSLPAPIKVNAKTHPEIVVIGASAGGPGALAQTLGHLPKDFPLPILVVQHLSADFVTGFADWLSRRCQLDVRIPIQGDLPTAGTIWIAPGGKHMSLSADGRVMLHSEKGIYRHQPSIDILFENVSKVFGAQAIGILLTGMGDDGAAGLLTLYKQGARTIAQDEETCVIFGMPAAAIERKAVEYVLPIQQISTALLDLVGYHRLNSQL